MTPSAIPAAAGRSPSKPRLRFAAAALAVLLSGGLLLCCAPAARAAAIAQPTYPNAVPYPDRTAPDASEQYKRWAEALEAQRRPDGYASGLEPFWQQSMRTLLGGDGGNNKAASPVSLYLALAMLAETTGGQSQAQLLALLGSSSLQALRSQAGDVWNAHYRNDGTVTSLLANSIWLDQSLPYRRCTLQALARYYYASAFRGEMGSPALDSQLHQWIDGQTGGLLAEAAGQLHFDSQTVLGLVSTVYYKARWAAPFDAANTAPGVFYAPGGEATAQYMHSTAIEHYYTGSSFAAVQRPMANSGGSIWLILPAEGLTPGQLLAGEELYTLLSAPGSWPGYSRALVRLAVPKWDITVQNDLQPALQAMGVQDVFAPEAADFSPLLSPLAWRGAPIYLSQAQQAVRVTADEEGVQAASFTALAAVATSLVLDQAELVLDRPFLFVIQSESGLPLFAGVVNQPGA